MKISYCPDTMSSTFRKTDNFFIFALFLISNLNKSISQLLLGVLFLIEINFSISFSFQQASIRYWASVVKLLVLTKSFAFLLFLVYTNPFAHPECDSLFCSFLAHLCFTISPFLFFRTDNLEHTHTIVFNFQRPYTNSS